MQFFIFILWIFLGLVGFSYASDRGLSDAASFAWFLVCFFFGIIGLGIEWIFLHNRPVKK